MKTFKTAKGTELPLMDIKGKDYLQAGPRIFWMREEHPDWSIETELLNFSEKHAVFKATIRDGSGKILAQASSMETIAGFDAYLEKAETCAVSRAAAFCGYGTLMAQELEEQGKLAESPVESRKPVQEGKPGLEIPNDLSQTICPFGKDKGLTFAQIGKPALAQQRDYWVGRARAEKLSANVDKYIDAINRYLAQ